MAIKSLTLTPPTLPFAGKRACPKLYLEGEACAEEKRSHDSWTVSVKPKGEGGEAEAELELPLGKPDGCEAGKLSFPCMWAYASRGRKVSFSTERLVFAGEGLGSWLKVELFQVTPVSFHAEAEGYTARVYLRKLKKDTEIRFSADRKGEDLPWGGSIGRETPFCEAAELFCRYFPFLAGLEQCRFGELLQDHRKVLGALKDRSAYFRSLGRPGKFRVLVSDDGAAVSGYEAVWKKRKLVFLAGERIHWRFWESGEAVEFLGTGEVKAVFPEQCKGFVAYKYDVYGRPLLVWGGRKSRLGVLRLSPGERLEFFFGIN